MQGLINCKIAETQNGNFKKMCQVLIIWSIYNMIIDKLLKMKNLACFLFRILDLIAAIPEMKIFDWVHQILYIR